ncbi:hypothetical protein [Nocardiopsis chromatogenes]|uniref:hypothetical protein n=1 Tax=Nocardiopsis chromatogenes TaxID=280239 RepID=UPI000348EFF1|nr:hypothetical protein [Nocardiopsis chromatogenes]
MHRTLTDHARCLYGDEYRPTPPCGLEHSESRFIEEPTFADADTLLAMVRELCPNVADGHLPVRVRNLTHRPDDPALMREAAANLWMHGPGWDDIAADLDRRADALEGA